MSKSGSRSVLTKSNLEQYRTLVSERVKLWGNDESRDMQDIEEGENLIRSLEQISHRYDECAVLRKALPEKDQEILKGMGFTGVDETPKWSNDMMRSLEKHGGSLVEYDDETSASTEEEEKKDEKVEKLPFEDDVLDLPTLGDERYDIGGTESMSFDLNEYLKEQEKEVNKMTSGLEMIKKEERRSSKKTSPPKEKRESIIKKSPPPERMIQKALFDGKKERSRNIDKEIEYLDTESSDVATSSDEERETFKGYPLNLPNFPGAPPEDLMMIMGYDDDDNEYLPTRTSSSSSTSPSEVKKTQKKKMTQKKIIKSTELSPIEAPKTHHSASPPRTVKNQPKVNNVAVVNEFVPPGLLSRQKKLEEQKKEKELRMSQKLRGEQERDDDDDDDNDDDDGGDHMVENDGDFEHILNLSQLKKETENYENQLLNKIHHLNPLKREEESKRLTTSSSSSRSTTSNFDTSFSKHQQQRQQRIPTSSQFPLPTPPQFPKLSQSSGIDIPQQRPTTTTTTTSEMPKLPLFPHPPPTFVIPTTTTTTTNEMMRTPNMASHKPSRKTPSTLGSTISAVSSSSATANNESMMMEEFEKIRSHELGQFKQFLKEVQGEFKEVFRNKLSKEEFYGMYKELKQEIEKIKSEKDDKLEREFQHLKQLIRKHIPTEEEQQQQQQQEEEEEEQQQQARKRRKTKKTAISEDRKKRRRKKKTVSPSSSSSSPNKKRRGQQQQQQPRTRPSSNSSDEDEDESIFKQKPSKRTSTTTTTQQQQQQQQHHHHKRLLLEEDDNNEEEDDEDEEELDFELRKREVRKMKKEEAERMQYHLMLNQTIKEENQMLRKFVRQIKSEMSNRKTVLINEIERLKQLVGECSLKDFSSMPIKQQEFEKLSEYEMKLVQLEMLSGAESNHQMYYPDDINDRIDHELSRLLNEMPIIGSVRIEVEKMEESKYLADQILHLKMVGRSSGSSSSGFLVISNMNNMPLEDYLMELYAPFINEEKRRVYMMKKEGRHGRSTIKSRVGGGRMMMDRGYHHHHHHEVGIEDNLDDDELRKELLMGSSGGGSGGHGVIPPSNLPPEYEMELENVLPSGVSPDIGMVDLLGRNMILERMKFERDYKSPELIDAMGGSSKNMTEGVGGRSTSIRQKGLRKKGRGGGSSRSRSRRRRGRGRGTGRKKRGMGRRSQQEEIVGGKKRGGSRGGNFVFDY